MDRFDVNTISKRAAIGVVALTSRTAFLQVIAFVATFLLTIFLSPEIFGVFFLVSAAVAFLNYFSDIGLAAALVQKRSHVSERELKTTFTIQQILVGFLVIIAFLASEKVGQFYGLSNQGIILFKALVISFFLSSLKTIPSIILERKLNFNRLVIPQIVETVGFYGVVVFLAYLGWGIKSFTVAVLVRGISGLIVMYIVAPWRPGFSFNLGAAKQLLSFGVPFQMNSILALVKDDLFTLYLGKVLPFNEIGYIGWAKKWAEVPLRLLMDNIIRVTFPTYSRLQHDKLLLKKGIEKTLFFLGLLAFPLTIGLIFAIKPVIALIPRYGKWEPALLSFYLFAISAALSTITSPLVNLLNSIGRVKITLVFMALWTVLTWTIIPFLLTSFGFNSVAAGILLISLTGIVLIFVVKRYVEFSLLNALGKPIISSLPLIILLFFIANSRLSPASKLVIFSLGGTAIWSAATYFTSKNEVLSLWRKLRHEK